MYKTLLSNRRLIVPQDKIALVYAVDLIKFEKHIIYTFIKVEDKNCSDKEYKIPYAPCGKVLQIDAKHNPVIINLAGEYIIDPIDKNDKCDICDSAVIVYRYLDIKNNNNNFNTCN